MLTRRAFSESISPIVACVPALALVLSVGVPSRAEAEPPILLWGFQRSCDRMADTDKTVERQLFKEHRNVALLKTPDGKPLPACTGEQCAQAFRAACPNAKGRLLGGQGIQGKPVRTRLWLYDLDSGQMAYQDQYCHTCNVIGALSEHSRSLIDHPNFGATPPGPTPMYCGGSTRTPGSGAPAPKGPVFLEVYGDGKHKQAVYAALRTQLEALSRAVLPIPLEAKDHSNEEMDRIVAGQQAAQVLSVLVQKAGSVTVQLYDQGARVTDADEVSCPECGVEPLISKIKDTVSDLLGRCAGSHCAELALSGAVEAPVSACSAFPTDICTSPQLDALLTASGPAAVGGGGLDPKTAKLIKGLTWGFFGAAVATSVGLFAANATTAGRRIDGNGIPITDTLWYPAWTAAGLAVVSLGVAVPLTIVANRQTRSTQTPSPTGSVATALIQCPN